MKRYRQLIKQFICSMVTIELLLSICTADTTEATVSPIKFHAIIIGINNYGNITTDGWPDLRTARNDAEALASLLQENYHFDVSLFVDEKATRSNIINALDQLASCDSNDAFLIYFAGHGFYDETIDEGFWIPYDSRNASNEHPTREDWIWNSILTKMLRTSPARHILVIADACYSGSLFRGRKNNFYNTKDPTWYLQALCRPSRIVITSGNYEPVSDSGARHSIFSQVLLNQLRYPDNNFIAASEIGQQLREHVGRMTGQMVRCEPLQMTAHAGGEFVFLADQKAEHLAAKALKNEDTKNYMLPVDTMENQDLKDIALLAYRGANQSATKLLESMIVQNTNNATLYQLKDYLSMNTQLPHNDIAMLWVMLEGLEGNDQSTRSTNLTSLVRPRLLAVKDPVAAGTSEDDIATAQLYMMCLKAALHKQDRIRILNRDALAEIFQELHIGFSDLADKRTQMEMGKLFPAGAILTLQAIDTDQGDLLMANVIDAQTSEIIILQSETIGKTNSISDTCNALADIITEKMIEQYPINTLIQLMDKTAGSAGLGKFHCAYQGMTFAIFPVDADPENDFSKPLGTATLTQLGEEKSLFNIQWDTVTNPTENTYRIIEITSLDE